MDNPPAQQGTSWADVAAFVAAGAAMLSALVSWLGTKANIESAKEQTDRERAMALRREVYLPAIEAISLCHAVLGQVTDLDVEIGAMGHALTAGIATISKVHLIASQPTVTALMNFQQALVPAYIELLMLRAPMAVRQKAITQQQTFADKAHSDRMEMIQLMKQYNLSGNRDADAWTRLQGVAEIENKTFQTHATQVVELQTEQAVAHVQLAERCMELSLAVAERLPEALLAARRELELPINETEYRREVTAQQEATARVMRELISRLTAIATDQAAALPAPAPAPHRS
jgi:hypothetical protein